jgi:hypothetical protein
MAQSVSTISRETEAPAAPIAAGHRSPWSPKVAQEVFICMSLGNLCFLTRWYDLEHLKDPAMDYYRSAPVNPTLSAATFVSASLLAVMFLAAWLWVKRTPTRAKLLTARCGFLLVLICVLESVRRYWNRESVQPDLGSNIALLVIELILVSGLVLTTFGNTGVLNMARRVVLLLTLLFPFFAIDLIWARVTSPTASEFAPRSPLPMLLKLRPELKKKHVLWLLFDEFDQRMAFDLRQPAGDLAALDRLRAESLVATQAHQTAGFTTMAVPCLLSGRLFSRVDVIDANTLNVYAGDSSPGTNWHDQPNVFKRARELGVNAELVGWHHPYCRMLGDSLVRCLDVPTGAPTDAMLAETSAADGGIPREVPYLSRLQLTDLVNIFRFKGDSATAVSQDEYMQQRQQQQYVRIRDAVYTDITDPRIGLLFAHFPTPHLFGIYNRKRKDFTLDDTLSYADNLALVDRTVGEIRQILEQADLWDSTTLLITSDHGFRPSMWRGRLGWNDELEKLTAPGRSETVPFIVKLPGQTQGRVFREPFSNVVSADLVLAILNGQISTYQDASDWLAKNANP